MVGSRKGPEKKQLLLEAENAPLKENWKPIYKPKPTILKGSTCSCSEGVCLQFCEFVTFLGWLSEPFKGES